MMPAVLHQCALPAAQIAVSWGPGGVIVCQCGILAGYCMNLYRIRPPAFAKFMWFIVRYLWWIQVLS